VHFDEYLSNLLIYSCENESQTAEPLFFIKHLSDGSEKLSQKMLAKTWNLCYNGEQILSFIGRE